MTLFIREQGSEAYAIKGGLQEWRERSYPVEERKAGNGCLDGLLS